MSQTPLKDDIEQLSEDQRNVLKSLRASRMVLPILLGLGVVAFLVLRNFDFEKIKHIHWSAATFGWIALAFALMVIRHLAFSLRMWVLAQGHFSFVKCIELVMIFEFSLCITPTTAGGAAVSLFVLTQEHLSAARTTTIVLYKVVLDTLFFVGTFPLLFAINGAKVIRPGMESLADGNWESRLFFFSYAGMVSYGLFLFYGLFVNPTLIKRALVGATRLPFLSRFNERMEKLGSEIVLASEDMKNIGWRQHTAAFGATWVAWTCKFLLISCLIFGIDHPTMTFAREVLLYSRLQAMFIIMALSPTPGGAGIAEGLFYPFLHDFLSNLEVATVIALIWRLMSYYLYLAAGAIVVPNWIRKVFLKNLKKEN
ncbi:MAG: flippase-like domain-containing protein [Saprospiraceae bacterium]|nr:flippase-like domain-containing protein [Saprospiraceae bacterium]